jgi:lysophospholipase L1-like esterase
MYTQLTALVAGMTLACTFTLSACGGGGGGSAPSPQVAPAASSSAKTHVTIYLDGDSTNHGVDADYPSGMTPNTPAARMQADFDAALPGQVTVIDGSISGNALPYDLQTGGPVTVPLVTRLAQLPVHADIVITNSEINDQYTLFETADQYSSWMKQWIDSVRSYNSMPIIEQPNPVCSVGSNIPVSDQFVDIMDSIAAESGVYVLPVYSAFKAQPNWCGTLLGKDGIHPSDAGYAFKESQYFAALLPAVLKIIGR